MSITNETALMELKQNFLLPTMVDNSEFSSDELAEEMDGLTMSFPRVKIPSGGALQFEVPTGDADHPDYTPTLVGVILFNHSSNAYWPGGAEYDDDTVPICSSVDGKIGFGEPGGACEACMLNQFGSDGKGKACKNMRQLYLLRSGSFIPLQLTLPPTSIKPFREFYNFTFATHRRATCGSGVEIGLTRVDKVNVYSVATFKKLFDFEGEQLLQVKAIAESYKAQIKAMLQQRAEENANRPGGDDLGDLGDVDGYPVMGGEDSFIIGAAVNGDRDRLPA